MSPDQTDVRSTAEGANEQPGCQWDGTEEARVSGLVVLGDVVPPRQEYILNNILMCQALLLTWLWRKLFLCGRERRADTRLGGLAGLPER